MEESSIESLQCLVSRQSYFAVLRYLSIPELVLVKTQLEQASPETIGGHLWSMWLGAGLPLTDFHPLEVKSIILDEIAPRMSRDRAKYWEDHWKERVMARVRMGVLPTRVWAKSMRLCQSDLCRHCGLSCESLDHLFGHCPSLDYTLLLAGLSAGHVEESGWSGIQQCARDTSSESFRVFSNLFFQFLNDQDVFKRD
jgi:hypothetical protein